MEERIISYDLPNQISKIIKTNTKENFFFVKHNSYKKLLFFKKQNPSPILFARGLEC